MYLCCTVVLFLGSVVCRTTLRDPTVAPNMWCQNLKQYPSVPAGGNRGDLNWAIFPLTLGEELLMNKYLPAEKTEEKVSFSVYLECSSVCVCVGGRSTERSLHIINNILMNIKIVIKAE